MEEDKLECQGASRQRPGQAGQRLDASRFQIRLDAVDALGAVLPTYSEPAGREI